VAPPFLCPVTHGCAAALPGGCAAPQCKYAACPVRGLSAANFSFAPALCRMPLPTASCLECLPAVLRVFYAAGVLDMLPLESCIIENTPQILLAGADVDALSIFENCTAFYAFTASANCSVSLPPSAFASSAAACADPAYACSMCGSDVMNVFIRAGAVTASDYGRALTLAEYDAFGSCIAAHQTQLLAAGASAETLARTLSCPQPERRAFYVFASLRLDGCAAADADALILVAVLVQLTGVGLPNVTVQSVVDAGSAAGSRRRRGRRLVAAASAAAPAAVVRFAVLTYAEEVQARAGATLRAGAADGTLAALLVAAGLPVTNVTLLSIADGDGVAAGTDSGGGSSSSSRARLFAGAVAGSVLGALALGGAAAAWALVRQRRRRAAARDAAYDELGLTPGGASGASAGGSMLSDGGASTLSGWQAVTSTADEVQLRDLIGTGAFATVHRAAWRGSEVAVKVWSLGLKQELAALNSTSDDATSATSAVRQLGGSTFLGSTRLGSVGDAPAGDADAQRLPLAATMTAAAAQQQQQQQRMDASFMRECMLLSSLRHPNILAIYALVKSPPMMVMELGAAGSLRDVLARSSLATLPWPRRLGICAGVACGVDFLHSQSPPIIHTDLKSANVVLDLALVPKVADFGVSIMAPETSEHVTMRRGTPRYMAPEVARGEVISNSKAIDAYGMGVVMYDVAHINSDAEAPARLREAGLEETTLTLTQALTNGTNSARWGSIQVLFQREIENYEPRFAAHVPPPLEALVRQAMALQPDARPTLPSLRARLTELAEEAAAW
jgi:serine/threonine protein kinase